MNTTAWVEEGKVPYNSKRHFKRGLQDSEKCSWERAR